MRNLIVFFTNPFDSREISLAELAAFSTDSLGRMIANNPDGNLTDRIAATTTAIGALVDSETDDQVQLGIRKGVKLAKDDFRSGLAEAIRPVYGAVLMAFNDPSPEFNQVFPSGRVIFGDARDDQLLKHLNTMVTGVTALQGSLAAGTVTAATQIRDSWLAIYTASESASGEKVATEAQRRQARQDVQLELFFNLTRLMELFPRQPGILGLYMQQQLLGGPTPGPVTGGTGGEDSSSSEESESSEESSLSSASMPSSSSFFTSSSSSFPVPPSSSSSSLSSFFSSSSSLSSAPPVSSSSSSGV